MATGLTAIVERNMSKLADIASDAMAPLLQQYAMQSPPPNMDILVQLMAKKLEQDLMQSLQGDTKIDDPMDVEISRLEKMKRHAELRGDLQKHMTSQADGESQRGVGSESSATASSPDQRSSLFGGGGGSGPSQGMAAPGAGGGSPFGSSMAGNSQAPIR